MQPQHAPRHQVDTPDADDAGWLPEPSRLLEQPAQGLGYAHNPVKNRNHSRQGTDRDRKKPGTDGEQQVQHDECFDVACAAGAGGGQPCPVYV